jgi:CxxC motif-containing protein (DUF1111 family)
MPAACMRAFAVLTLAGCATPEPAAPAAEPAAAPPLRRVVEDPSDAPIPGLDPESLALFEEGDARFERPFREAQGLGPLYIHRACTNCHEHDARGPGTVRRIARSGENAPALPFGDVVRPRTTAGARTPIRAPEHPAIRETIRLPPAVFGRGYLEAIPEATILAHEAAQAARDDGIHGRAARLAGREGAIGRFGHKARETSLEEFIADALHGDMGLTSPRRPEELPNPDGLRDDARPGIDVSEADIRLLAGYVRLLAIPRREAIERGDEIVSRGAALFEQVRCAVCHVPSMRTRADHEHPALRDVEVALYTDLLLHDLGEGLADGIAEGAANGRQWRTAPLIGIRHLRALLHDGRASTIREAIEAHASPGSEANDSVARFRALSADEQLALIEFVRAL